MKPSLPERIDRYEIRDRLGRGGMGVVYLATDPALGRTVAIKMLTEDNEELRERFALEARSAAALKHSNIVTIYDVGEDGGRPFIAMEYLDGETMAEIIRRREPVGLDRKLAWMLELCAGLGYAHRSKIVHRDIKPSNLMITADGTLKILDFGIARVTADATSSGLTRMGMLMGSPHYMSPEQAEGLTVDERSDIFSVGLVLYELLCSERAFSGDTPNVILNNILNREPRPIREHCPDLDPELERIVQRGLVKDRTGRYQSLSAVASDLARVRERLLQSPGGTIIVDRGTPSPGVMAFPTPSRTPSVVDSSAIARRRASQIEQHLDEASGHFKAGRYEEAIEQSERALVIDPEQARALEILQITKRAMDARQVRQWLDESETLKADGDLAGAERLIGQSLQLQPDSIDAQASLIDLKDRRRKRDRLPDQAVTAPPVLAASISQPQPGPPPRPEPPPFPTGAIEQQRSAPPPPPTPVSRSGPGKFALLVPAGALLLIVAVGGWWWTTRRPTDSAPIAEPPPTASASPAPPPAAPPISDRAADFTASLSEAGRLRDAGGLVAAIDEARKIPDSAREAGDARTLITGIRTDAAQAARSARAAAQTAGAKPDALRAGDARLNDAEQSRDAGVAVAAYLAATAEFNRAASPAVAAPAPSARPLETPPPASSRGAEIQEAERLLKQSLAARNVPAARAQLEKIRRLDERYAGLASLDASIRDTDAAMSRERDAAAADDRRKREAAATDERKREAAAPTERNKEAAAADERKKQAAALLEESRGLASHAEAIARLKRAATMDPDNAEIRNELGRRDALSNAELNARSVAATRDAAMPALRDLLSQFAGVFNGDNNRKAEGFRKLWPSMTPADLNMLNSHDTADQPRDWPTDVSRATIVVTAPNRATASWPITLRGRDRGQKEISYEERTAEIDFTLGAAWTIARVAIKR